MQPQPGGGLPQLSRYLRALYLVPGIAATVDMDHIKRHYYLSHPHINPTGIVPAGPRLKFCEPAQPGGARVVQAWRSNTQHFGLLPRCPQVDNRPP